MPRWPTEGRRTFDVHDIRVQPVAETGCWLWMGVVNHKGYGRVSRDGRLAYAHRAFWENRAGPVGDGMVIDHVCRERSCVNPDHLRSVTVRENVTENSASVVAAQAQQACCKRGHPLSGENLRTTRSSHGTRRVCRACRRAFEASPAQREKANRRRRINPQQDVTDAE